VLENTLVHCILQLVDFFIQIVDFLQQAMRFIFILRVGCIGVGRQSGERIDVVKHVGSLRP
jgi:hypothetical protein